MLQDGSAVEIVGLSYACLRDLSALHTKGLFAHGSVSRASDGVTWTLAEWADLIKTSFEARFHVGEEGHYNKGIYR